MHLLSRIYFFRLLNIYPQFPLWLSHLLSGVISLFPKYLYLNFLNEVLLKANFFSFCFPACVFISPSFVKYSFSWYTITDWKYFLSALFLKKLFQCKLAFTDAVRKSSLNLIASSLQVIFLFYLDASIVFSLPVVFCSFTSISWGLSFFLFTFFNFIGFSESEDPFLSLILKTGRPLVLPVLSILSSGNSSWRNGRYSHSTFVYLDLIYHFPFQLLHARFHS